MEYDKIKWKTKVCHVGKECWCRGIITIDNDEVISEASIDKEFAEYVIFLHNRHLKEGKE